MQWILSGKKDFIGRRSLARPAMLDPMRKRLVGLETEDPATVLPEGAQILGEPPSAPPETMIGHVTSSYWSAALGRSIALALVRGGRDREPGAVHVPLDDRTVRATIRDPGFYDPEGERLHG
jgi:sarcosine oxidase subunit alpha